VKKFLNSLLNILKDFIFNSFWKSWPLLVMLFFSLAINAILWYIFQTRIKENAIPFFFASGLILLNLILGNYLWEREKLLSFFLVGIGLFTQILMLVFIRYLMMVF